MPRSANAEIFRSLHASEGILILPNVWDAGGARLVESCGARAIATTSAGLAWAHGYRDGNAIPVSVLVAAVEAMLRVIEVPLTVDCEGGYSDDPERVAELVTRLAQAGAVGINIEDGSAPPELLCAKIGAVKTAAVRAGVDVFINVRTDVFLRNLVPDAQKTGETLERAARYRAAGGDGLFVPGVAEREVIRALAAGAQPMALNVMARPSLPPARELQALGVRRLSAGAALSSSVFAVTERLAKHFLEQGDSAPLYEAGVAYQRMNELFPGS
jgi:2-methylisocitrate lyase-like PEP mutase family enzyme